MQSSKYKYNFTFYYSYYSQQMQACITQLAKKFKKVQAKKLVKLNTSKSFFREIVFLAVLNFSPTSKIDFWPFLKLQKIDFCRKHFCEIDLFDFA